jgi:predicted O-linked N-acetylglucosamine transferase (SPINDLY family)
MRSRLASGMLRHIGLDELVATSDSAYVELAVALANDAGRRRDLRERLRSARERLFEDDAPVRALEAFLARAVAR